MFSSCHVRVSEWIHTLHLPECQGNPSSKQAWKISDLALVLSKEFLDIHANIERGFTLKRVRNMIRTYSQMHHTHKYSQHCSITWPVWLNDWVFIYELSGCEFESHCSQLKIIFLFMLVLNTLQYKQCLFIMTLPKRNA